MYCMKTSSVTADDERVSPAREADPSVSHINTRKRFQLLIKFKITHQKNLKRMVHINED